MVATKATSESKVKSSKSAVQEYYYGTGKRKMAVAKVRLYKNGKGEIKVNDQDVSEYFPLKEQHQVLLSPLKLTSSLKKFDITVVVKGGGIIAQSEAIRHGISRALLEFDEALRLTLKKAGLLTRDPRVKERKKPGLHKARRAPQFSKR
jgi:small subunit ribosomal protein S9